MVSTPSWRRATTFGWLSGSTVKTLTRVVTALSTRMVVSMAGLPVWLFAGKVARIPPAKPLATKARRNNLVSIAGMGDPLLGAGLPTDRIDRPAPCNSETNRKGQADRCAENK